MILTKEDYGILSQIQLLLARVMKNAVMSEIEEEHEREFEKSLIESNDKPDISQTLIIKELREMLIKLNIGGSPRIRKNGLLEVRSQIYGSTYGRTVEELEANLIKKIKYEKSHQGNRKKAQTVTAPLLSEFFEQTYLPYKKTELQPDSLEAVKYDFKWIIQGLNDKRLENYSSEEIEAFLLSVPRTRKRKLLRGTLNNIFKYAVKIKALPSNPMENVSQVKHKSQKGRALTFNSQEVFFDNLYSSNLSLTMKLFLTFVYLTGTRRGEALAVTVSDIDFEGNVLHIPGTKTEKSDRYCPLHPLVKKLAKLCVPNSEGKLFPLSKDAPTHAMEKVIKGYHLHELRHTYGTISICVKKLDIKTTALYMGHSSINMTLNTYTHPEQLDMPTFFNGNLNEEEKLQVLRDKYNNILIKIETFLNHTQNIPKE